MSRGLKKISTVIIQSNAYGTRDNGGRNENAGDGFGEDEGGEKEKDIDGNSWSSGIPHILLD